MPTCVWESVRRLQIVVALKPQCKTKWKAFDKKHGFAVDPIVNMKGKYENTDKMKTVGYMLKCHPEPSVNLGAIMC